MLGVAIVWIGLMLFVALIAGTKLGRAWERHDREEADVREMLDGLERIHVRSVPAKW